MDGVSQSADEIGAREENSRSKKLQKKATGKVAKEAYETESRVYFESISELPILFVDIKKVVKPYIYLDIRNLIVLSIYQTFCLDKWVRLRLVLKERQDVDKSDEALDDSSEDSNVNFLLLRLNSGSFSSAANEIGEIWQANESGEGDDKKVSGTRVKHPSVEVADKNLTICGISSVLRFMFKYVCYLIERNHSKTNEDEDILVKLKQFLGFRGGCLQACAESSVWTKFCEVDMINAVNDIKNKADKFRKHVNNKDLSFELKVSESLLQFERHLSLPVKVHNYRKVIQDIKKIDATSSDISDNLCKDFDQKVLIADLKHEYAEGATLLLSDLILYPSVHSYVLFYGKEKFREIIPITFEWYEKLHKFFQNQTSKLSSTVVISHDSMISHISGKEIRWNVPGVLNQSLYSKDPKRYKPTLRQFTRQPEIDETLEFLKSKGVTPFIIHEVDPAFKWDDVPLLAHPEGGSLPKSRRLRKCDQLASMAFYALEVYFKKEKHHQPNTSVDNNSKTRFRIVDFCSGGGHVGILVAWLLPNCDVILVENKDESLRRAQKRVSGLGLSNVFFYQSNLDYFDSDFDLGLALHACGTATDLVLAKCVASNASFVCSPCCYGAIQENHILSYPRSSAFKQTEIPLRNYFVLCHSSDHTHDESHEKTSQGKECMTLIDTDRCLYALDNRYDVKLCKMVPETASPKNHILVGVSPSLESLLVD